MLPLRCVVETAEKGRCCDCAEQGSGLPLLESYAIVTGDTKMCDLCSTVLDALGMPHLKPFAKGKIKIKNWKALNFDQITTDLNETVDSLLKELSNNICLSIVVSPTDDSKATIPNGMPSEAKDQLLQYLMAQHMAVMSAAGDPQNKMMMEQLTQADASSDTSLEGMQRLMQFWQQMSLGAMANGAMQEATKQQATQLELLRSQLQKNDPSAAKGGPFANGLDNALASLSTAFSSTVKSSENGFTSGEQTKLARWFRDSPNPSKQRLNQYLTHLNSNLPRKNHNKVTMQQLLNWFSTARVGVKPKPKIDDILSGIGMNGVSKAYAQNVRNSGISDLIRNNIEKTPQCIVKSEPSSSPTSNASANGDGPMENSSAIGFADASEIVNGRSTLSPGEIKTDLVAFSDNMSPEGGETSTGNDLSIDDASNDDDHSSNNDLERNDGLKIDQQQRALSELFAKNLFGGSLAPLYLETAGTGIPPGSISIVTNESGEPSPSGFKSGSFLSTPSYASALDDVKGEIRQNGGSSAQHRSRLMFDPLTEVPLLEKWFDENPHPSWLQIDQYTETLNNMSYRTNYPPITTYNVKIWFKNRRAKCKRLTIGSSTTQHPSLTLNVV